MRSILNKLTPQMFDKLLKQIRELEINSTERLEGSISLIFEKAIEEPNFAVAYGKLCKELCDVSFLTATDVINCYLYASFHPQPSSL